MGKLMGLRGGVIGNGDISTCAGAANDDNPLPVKATITELCLTAVRALELMARCLSLAAADLSGFGRLRVIADMNSGTLTTLTTCSTVTNVTSVNRLAGIDAGQTLLYDTMRTNWNTSVLSQIVITP